MIDYMEYEASSLALMLKARGLSLDGSHADRAARLSADDTAWLADYNRGCRRRVYAPTRHVKRELWHAYGTTALSSNPPHPALAGRV